VLDEIKNLSTKEEVLKLCKLMFQTENIHSRLEILDIMLVSKVESKV
jgi:hypothetical protein